jgi:hypothetical protein
MDIKESYQQIITEFIEATKLEKVSWNKQNPTTYYLETVSNSDKAIVSIQKAVIKGGIVRVGGRVVRQESKTNFLFAVRNPLRKDQIVQIETSTDPSYKDVLNDRFNSIELSLEKKNIDFLKGIIKNLK